ncbi:MAG: hypothetical protein ALECFALPRED_004515 [Alectoria fallacina]|uniref:Uncharacterized protein n=1 Tax=Alectoria fallacina TaxID=1903189 RepID=A0A8H3FSK9_9LECA|nr:MAG: hypothetical protein ALECFALPRED_004515 [Alectoria fallacina]
MEIITMKKLHARKRKVKLLRFRKVAATLGQYWCHSWSLSSIKSSFALRRIFGGSDVSDIICYDFASSISTAARDVENHVPVTMLVSDFEDKD